MVSNVPLPISHLDVYMDVWNSIEKHCSPASQRMMKQQLNLLHNILVTQTEVLPQKPEQRDTRTVHARMTHALQVAHDEGNDYWQHLEELYVDRLKQREITPPPGYFLFSHARAFVKDAIRMLTISEQQVKSGKD
jgi:hypothetical protein